HTSAGMPPSSRSFFSAAAAHRHLPSFPTRRSSDLLGVPPSQCVVFEDSPAGVTAAVRAGARCVALATSVPAEKLLAEGARLALADFEGVDAEALLEQAAR